MNTLPFGTDGVRGPALEVAQNAQPLAEAAGLELMKPGDTALVTWDTRESSEHIALQVAAGLTAVGVTTELAGVMPTPGLAYSVREDARFTGGVMITASHNPYQDNGIKIFGPTGEKLTDDQQDRIETRRGKEAPRDVFGGLQAGEYHQMYYGEFLLRHGPNLRGVTLAVDTAHGAASGIAEDVFGNLGASVIPLHDKPDGRNINVRSGATNTEVLREVARERGVIGVAFDGDADRLIMVDEQGREFDGDRIMHMLVTTTREDGMRHRGLVATVMTNLAIEQELLAQGIDLHRTAVGDRYVLEGLAQTGYELGGEQSGHIIQTDKLATGDGMLAAVQALRAQRQSGLSLAEWYDQLTLVPQGQVNLRIPRSVMRDRRVIEMLATETERFGQDGRVVARPSGTEDLVRIMVESPNATVDAKRIASAVLEIAQAAN